MDTASGAASEQVEPSARSGGEAPIAPVGSQGWWKLCRSAMVALLVGWLVTGLLTWLSQTLYEDNESRLLDLRARDLGLVLTAAQPSIQTPLASAAGLADASKGDLSGAESFLRSYVGPGRSFVSASLWAPGATRPSAVVGQPPMLASSPARAASFIARARNSPELAVTEVLGGRRSPRLGYGFSTPARHGFVAYAEGALPKNRRTALPAGLSYADLNFALYLGSSERRADLLLSTLTKAPQSARHAVDHVKFGDKSLTLIVTAKTSLSGAFSESLPWIIAGVGALLTVIAALLVDRLVRRRKRAERLAVLLDRAAEEAQERYREQRGIAAELQHALMPEIPARVGGLQASARYIAGGPTVDVGGDWFDLIDTGPLTVTMIVGDVSGRGIRAASTMAMLRSAAVAYAAQDDRPGVVLSKLSALVSRMPHDYFATVLCAALEVESNTLTLASAGHLPPLLIGAGGASYAELDVGPPIGAAHGLPARGLPPIGAAHGLPARGLQLPARGLSRGLSYKERASPLPPGTTMIAFTDGLVERRGEVIDAGLARLRRAATEGSELPLDDLVSKLLADLAHDAVHDDTAILGVRLPALAGEAAARRGEPAAAHLYGEQT